MDSKDLQKDSENNRLLALQELTTIIDTVPDLICMIDKEGKLVNVNKRIEELVGHPRTELIGRDAMEFILAEDRAIAAEGLEEASVKGRSSREVRVITKEGKEVFHSFMAVALYDREGVYNGLVCIGRDITERRKEEETLRKSEAGLKEAQRIAGLGSWELDFVNNEVSQSDENYRIFGVTPDEFDGSLEAFLRLVHPDDRNFVEESIQKALFEKTPYDIEFRIIRPDGTERIVHDQAEVTHDESGKPLRMVGTILDITERRKMSEELLKVDKLESLGILAGGIAHDFNNILTALLGNIFLAKLLVKPPDRVFEILNELEKASHRAQALTSQLLTFSRGGSPVRRNVQMGALMREWCQFILSGSNITLEWMIPADLWPVEIDEGQLQQVFHNLVINAAQAMLQGGTIRIEAMNLTLDEAHLPPLGKGRYIRISVEDQGTGISKENLPKIFDPFFTTKEHGSGLGLATSYSIIRNHGGAIQVETELGSGTTFSVYLPASGKEVITDHTPEENRFQGAGRILVMDDEEIIRSFVREALMHYGYVVELAREGSEAIDLYRRALELGQPFDAVVVDLTIPGGMGGLEATKEILRMDPEAKVIVSSGYSNNPIMSDYRKYGFRGVVAKPYRLAELSDVVYKVIKANP